MRISDWSSDVCSSDLGRVIGGEDRIIVNLDSRPDDDRFALHADINAPAGGLVGKIAGLKQDATLKIEGRGSWTKWEGSLSAAVDKKPLAQLAMEAAKGQYHLSGTLQPQLIDRKSTRLDSSHIC